MIFLIFYDISSDTIRNKVAKRLVAEGYDRIQLSVFSGIKNPKDNKLLWGNLQQWLAGEPTAKFFVLKTSKNNFKNMQCVGTSDWDMDYLIGVRHSLFF